MHEVPTSCRNGEPLKQSEIGLVPESWRVARLDQIATIERGKFAHRPRNAPQFYGGSVPFVQTGDVSRCNGRIRCYTQTLNERGLAISRMFPRGTILITIAANIGFTGILEFDSACTDSLVAITPVGGDSAEFLNYYLQTQQPIMDRLAPQGTQKNINIQFLKPWLIPLPPIDEQRQIAVLLSAVQRAIERQERLISLTAELKKALMHKLFTEGTRGEPLKQQTCFGAAPASWDLASLGECCQVQTGIAKGRKINSDDAITVPYLRVANVQDGHLDLGEVKTISIRKNELPRFGLRPGDVVLTEGGDLDKLGRGFIWHGEVPECVHQNHVFAVRPDRSRLSSEFIAYQTQSPYGKAYFLSVAHKTTNLACINTSKLKAFPVLIPTAEEQREIVNILQLVDQRQSIATKILAATRHLFRTLLHQLMTAQVRVHDLDLSALKENTGRAGAA